MPDDIEHPPRGYTTEDVKSVEEEEPKAGRRRFGRWKLFVLALVAIPVLVFALWTWVALGWTYSEGKRVGWVQKFSRKGWLCKTWEGELAMSNVPGSAPEIFQFTVRDDSVAQQVNDVAGKRVELYYDEHKGVPTSCFGETRYFVTRVRATQ